MVNVIYTNTDKQTAELCFAGGAVGMTCNTLGVEKVQHDPARSHHTHCREHVKGSFIGV